MDKYNYIKRLHEDYGAVIPKEKFTPEIYDLLLEFKTEWKDNWLDDEYIFSLANLDCYNEAWFKK